MSVTLDVFRDKSEMVVNGRLKEKKFEGKIAWENCFVCNDLFDN